MASGNSVRPRVFQNVAHEEGKIAQAKKRIELSSAHSIKKEPCQENAILNLFR